DGIVAVLRLVDERLPLPFRVELAPYILRHENVAAPGVEAGLQRLRAAIGRALQDDGELARRVRAIDVGGQLDAVAHGDLDSRLLLDVVSWLGEPRIGGRFRLCQ